MSGAAVVGIAMSTEFYHGLEKMHPFLVPKLPRFDRKLSTELLASMTSLEFLFDLWSIELVQLFFFSEIFFSFIHCFTTLALVYSSKGGEPMVGVSELKRFVSGTLIFLGPVSVGERPTLHLGYTATVAAYFHDPRILIILGLGNIVGFSIAYLVFRTQLAGGPIKVVAENFTLFPSLFFSSQSNSPKSPRARATSTARVTSAPRVTPSTKSSQSELTKRSGSRSAREDTEGPTRRSTRLHK